MGCTFHPCAASSTLRTSSTPMHPSASIHHLAVELLEQIFTYVCTDGGYTGRSLSLVSRHFREVVRPIRFNSIALSSCRAAESFLVCFEKERGLAPIRVQHLLLSTWADGEQVLRVRNGHPPAWDGHTYHPSTALPQGPQWRVWMTLQESIDKKLSRVLPRLLKTLATDLFSLSIVHSWEFGAIQLPSVFPCLRHFTFCGPPPAFPTYRSQGRRLPPCFPSLRHLHLVSWNVSITSWIQNSPAITHLRLSDLTSSSTSLPDQLMATILGGAGKDSSSQMLSSRPSLVHVRLQPRGTQHGYCGTPDVEHSLFVWKLKNMSMRTRPDVRFELMRDRRYHDGYWDRRIRRDWLDDVAEGQHRRSGWWLGGEDMEDGDEDMGSVSDRVGASERLVSHWMQGS